MYNFNAICCCPHKCCNCPNCNWHRQKACSYRMGNINYNCCKRRFKASKFNQECETNVPKLCSTEVQSIISRESVSCSHGSSKLSSYKVCSPIECKNGSIKSRISVSAPVDCKNCVIKSKVSLCLPIATSNSSSKKSDSESQKSLFDALRVISANTPMEKAPLITSPEGSVISKATVLSKSLVRTRYSSVSKQMDVRPQCKPCDCCKVFAPSTCSTKSSPEPSIKSSQKSSTIGGRQVKAAADKNKSNVQSKALANNKKCSSYGIDSKVFEQLKLFLNDKCFCGFPMSQNLKKPNKSREINQQASKSQALEKIKPKKKYKKPLKRKSPQSVAVADAKPKPESDNNEMWFDCNVPLRVSIPTSICLGSFWNMFPSALSSKFSTMNSKMSGLPDANGGALVKMAHNGSKDVEPSGKLCITLRPLGCMSAETPPAAAAVIPPPPPCCGIISPTESTSPVPSATKTSSKKKKKVVKPKSDSWHHGICKYCRLAIESRSICDEGCMGNVSSTNQVHHQTPKNSAVTMLTTKISSQYFFDKVNKIKNYLSQLQSSGQHVCCDKNRLCSRETIVCGTPYPSTKKLAQSYPQSIFSKTDSLESSYPDEVRINVGYLLSKGIQTSDHQMEMSADMNPGKSSNQFDQSSLQINDENVVFNYSTENSEAELLTMPERRKSTRNPLPEALLSQPVTPGICDCNTDLSASDTREKAKKDFQTRPNSCTGKITGHCKSLSLYDECPKYARCEDQNQIEDKNSFVDEKSLPPTLDKEATETNFKRSDELKKAFIEVDNGSPHCRTNLSITKSILQRIIEANERQAPTKTGPDILKSSKPHCGSHGIPSSNCSSERCPNRMHKERTHWDMPKNLYSGSLMCLKSNECNISSNSNISNIGSKIKALDLKLCRLRQDKNKSLPTVVEYKVEGFTRYPNHLLEKGKNNVDNLDPNMYGLQSLNESNIGDVLADLTRCCRQSTSKLKNNAEIPLLIIPFSLNNKDNGGKISVCQPDEWEELEIEVPKTQNSLKFSNYVSDISDESPYLTDESDHEAEEFVESSIYVKEKPSANKEKFDPGENGSFLSDIPQYKDQNDIPLKVNSKKSNILTNAKARKIADSRFKIRQSNISYSNDTKVGKMCRCCHCKSNPTTKSGGIRNRNTSGKSEYSNERQTYGSLNNSMCSNPSTRTKIRPSNGLDKNRIESRVICTCCYGALNNGTKPKVQLSQKTNSLGDKIKAFISVNKNQGERTISNLPEFLQRCNYPTSSRKVHKSPNNRNEKSNCSGCNSKRSSKQRIGSNRSKDSVKRCDSRTDQRQGNILQYDESESAVSVCSHHFKNELQPFLKEKKNSKDFERNRFCPHAIKDYSKRSTDFDFPKLGTKIPPKQRTQDQGSNRSNFSEKSNEGSFRSQNSCNSKARDTKTREAISHRESVKRGYCSTLERPPYGSLAKSIRSISSHLKYEFETFLKARGLPICSEMAQKNDFLCGGPKQNHGGSKGSAVFDFQNRTESQSDPQDKVIVVLMKARPLRNTSVGPKDNKKLELYNKALCSHTNPEVIPCNQMQGPFVRDRNLPQLQMQPLESEQSCQRSDYCEALIHDLHQKQHYGELEQLWKAQPLWEQQQQQLQSYQSESETLYSDYVSQSQNLSTHISIKEGSPTRIAMPEVTKEPILWVECRSCEYEENPRKISDSFYMKTLAKYGIQCMPGNLSNPGDQWCSPGCSGSSKIKNQTKC